MDRAVRLLLVAALASASPLAAHSQPIPYGGSRPPPPPPADRCANSIAHPHWFTEPTPGEVWRQYPNIWHYPRTFAFGTLKPVDVKLLCLIDFDTGFPNNCQPLGRPPDEFVLAANRVLGLYRYDTTAMAGVEPGGCRKVELTIHFAVFDQPPPLPLPPDCCGQNIVVTQPQWVARPSQEDIRRVYPDFARDHGIKGVVRLRCKIRSDGHLRDCLSYSADPPGYAFPVAALKLAPLFELRPFTRDGESLGEATVTVPVVFTPDASQP
jgi:hypothetical protein